MPTCQSCGKEWTWKQTMKTLFKLKCPYCDKKQYESASSRKRSSMLGLTPLIFLPIVIWLEFSVGTALILAVTLSVLMFSVYPFILRLSEEIEPHW